MRYVENVNLFEKFIVRISKKKLGVLAPPDGGISLPIFMTVFINHEAVKKRSIHLVCEHFEPVHNTTRGT